MKTNMPLGQPWLSKPIKKPMKDSEILKKAIERAVKKGFECKNWQVLDFEGYKAKWIIYQHDFAKAFWGTEKNVEIGVFDSDPDDDIDSPVEYTDEIWKYHLQQMVLEENRISYLKRFI